MNSGGFDSNAFEVHLKGLSAEFMRMQSYVRRLELQNGDSYGAQPTTVNGLVTHLQPAKPATRLGEAAGDHDVLEGEAFEPEDGRNHPRPSLATTSSSGAKSSESLGPLAESYDDGEELATRSSDVQDTRKSRLRQTLILKEMDQMSSSMRRRSDRVSELIGNDLSTLRTTSCSEIRLACIIKNPLFDAACAFMILINAVLIGVEAEILSRENQRSNAVEILQVGCAVYFAAELCVRMVGLGTDFVMDPQIRAWNLFDFVLVVLSIVDFVMNSVGANEDVTLVRGVKMLRMLRIIRIFRVFRFFRSLTEMAMMIMDSINSLVYALILLAIILYVFAIFISSQTIDWLHLQVDTSQPEWTLLLENHSDPNVVQVNRKLGSLLRTINTLYQTSLNGVSWHEVSDPALDTGWTVPALYLIYIAFTMLAMLNIVTGIFVDNALKFAQSQRNIAIVKEMEKKDDYQRRIREFFEAIDEDGSGEITVEEFEAVLEDPTLSAYFRVLEFDVDDAKRFIRLCDVDDSGSLSIDEFMRGCMRFKGVAQALEVHMVLKEIKDVDKKMERICDKLELCES